MQHLQIKLASIQELVIPQNLKERILCQVQKKTKKKNINIYKSSYLSRHGRRILKSKCRKEIQSFIERQTAIAKQTLTTKNLSKNTHKIPLDKRLTSQKSFST